MNRSDAGQKGTDARNQKSHDELSQASKKAADTAEKRHPGIHAEAGAKGGKAHGSQQQQNESGSNKVQDRNKNKDDNE
jgi:hypothetical protein